MGKQTGANLDADWGSIQILIFPAGTDIPPDLKLPAAVPTGVASNQQSHPSADPTLKP
jgi:hypothetical protein